MTTALTVPLEDWVFANSRPLKTEAFDDLRALGARRDFSSLTIEDAFSLLYHACKVRFGNLKPLDFKLEESSGPLAYSCTLTVTGPDEIGISFPDSGKHSTVMAAKMHAAYQAVQQGVISFMMRGAQVQPNDSKTHDRPASKKAIDSLRGAQFGTLMRNPLPPKPIVPAGSAPNIARVPPNTPIPNSSATSGSLPSTSKKPANNMDKSPVSIINELLQKTYAANKMHKMGDFALKWDQRRYDEGYLARMTVNLPSGRTKSYGSVPDTLPTTYLKSKYPLKPELLPNVAKRAVATYAIKLGVLDFISEEDPTGRALATVGAPARSIPVQPKLSAPAASHPVRPQVPSVQTGSNAPRNDPPARSSMSISPVSTHPAEYIQTKTTTQSPIVPPIVPPATTTKPAPLPIPTTESPKAAPETFDAEIKSRHTTHQRLGSYEPLGNDEQSEKSMDLDSNAETTTPTPSTDYRKSPEVEDHEMDEEPPKKKQRVDPPTAEETTPEVGEAKIMRGASYVDILSAYCKEKGHAQPQVTYQRQLDESNPTAPPLYHLSLVIGTKRYELSKHYDNVQDAEEKLSRRILKNLGVTTQKG